MLLRFQIKLERLVLSLALSCLKFDMWLLYLILNVLEDNPIYSAWAGMSDWLFMVCGVTIALYMIELSLHLLSTGHNDPTRQLQFAALVLVSKSILLLWLDIICSILGSVLYDTFTVLRLTIFLRREPTGKCLSISLKNLAPTF